MSRIFWKSVKPVAQAPGTVQYVGRPRAEQVKVSITYLDYAQDHFVVKEVADVRECFPFRDTETVTWINVDGLHDTAVIQALGEHFGLHPLVQEDIVHTHQRPKLEDYQDYLYIVCRMISYDDRRKQIESEQISLILGPRFVISFQEYRGDVFTGVRERLERGKGRIRTAGSGYLAYALLDAVVDHYFVVLEKLGDEIEDMEEALLVRPEPHLLNAVHELKRELIMLRRSVWPLREVVGGLERSESRLIPETVTPFLRDVYDHIAQVADVVESFRDMATGLQDLYMTSISNKMNEVMKVLTIFATIFIPLTFVAGIYGMNFAFMPELNWRYGYAAFWVLILIVAGSMLVYFRRKRWL